MMKLSGYKILFFVFFIHSLTICQITSEDRYITLQVQNTHLRKILDKISVQKEVSFIFIDELIDNKMVTCDIKRKTVEEALDIIVRKCGIFYKCINNKTFVFYRNGSRKLSEVDQSDKDAKDNENSVLPPVRMVYSLPDYPILAKNNNVEGTVGVNLFIDSTGSVTEVKMLGSSGYSILDNAAIKFAYEMIFEPAKKGGIPFSSWLPMNLNYKLVSRSLIPRDYIEKLKVFYSDVKLKRGKGREDILKNILVTHINYIDLLSSEDDKYFNSFIQEIVSDTIKEQWRDFWSESSLYFLVFYDFMKRFPKTNFYDNAMLNFIKHLHNEVDKYKDANNIQESEIDQSDFLKSVYTFLEEEYPQKLSEFFRKEVDRK